MSVIQEQKPSLQEQVGVAVNASALTMTPERCESALVKVAALGAAAGLVARNKLAQDEPALHPTSARSIAEGRLVPLLWRMKFGGDATQQTAVDSVILFSDWMRGHPFWVRRDGLPIGSSLFRLFAARVIYEWLADKCPACGGTGLQELMSGGVRRRPRSFANPKVRHVRCGACRGTRRPVANKMARATALGISLAEYEARWPRRFEVAAIWLRALPKLLRNPLQSELERGINRA